MAWMVGLAGFVLGLLVFVGMAVVEWAAWVLVLPGRREGALAAAMAVPSGREESISATASDGVRLAGVWRPARESPARGVVILIRGFGEAPSARAMRSEALNAAGWDVVAIDPRAHGRSEGDRGSFGGREGDDVSVWIDALFASGRVRSVEPIVVWGRSMGAAIALRAAAKDARIAGLVLEASYVDLESTLARVLARRRLPFPHWFARRVLRKAEKLAGVALERPRPLDLAPSTRASVLLLHGNDDRLIPVEAARRLAGAFAPPARLVEVAGAGHSDVVDVGGSQVIEPVLAFLNALRPPG